MSDLLHSFAAGFIFFAGFVTGAALFVKLRANKKNEDETREHLENGRRIAAAHEKSAANLARIANQLELMK